MHIALNMESFTDDDIINIHAVFNLIFGFQLKPRFYSNVVRTCHETFLKISRQQATGGEELLSTIICHLII